VAQNRATGEIVDPDTAEPLAPGKHSLRYEFTYDGGGGKGGIGTLFIDANEAGRARRALTGRCRSSSPLTI
jgi:hypothetical protein